MDEDRRRWDERHGSTTAPASLQPARGLDDAGRTPRVPGRALDVACGAGGTAVWAAVAGLSVVAIDVSPVAIEATRRLARLHDVERRVDARVHDLRTGLPPGLGSFDLIVCQRYRDPALWPALVGHLRPGGVLAVTVLSEVGATAPGRFRAAAGELEAAFHGLGVTIEYSAEGGGEATVVAVGSHDTPIDRVRPMDNKLRAVLDELQSTIRRSEADGVIDDDERNELRSLAERIDALLAEEREEDGLVDHLEESAIRFEGNHPTIAAAIRSAVHTLTGYGM